MQNRYPAKRDTTTIPQADPQTSASIWPEIIWLVPLLLVPLWVNFWSFQPFDHSKSLLLIGWVWGAGGGWLVVQVWQGRLGASRWPRGWHSSSVWWLGAMILLWLAALSVATALAVDPWRSLWGSDARGQGLLTQVTYVLIFALIGTGFGAGARTGEQVARLYTVVALSSVPLLFLGGLQAAGLDPFGLVTDARTPIYTTLGRANFTGAYLALVLPMTLNRALLHGGGVRMAFGALALAQCGLIALTGARSAWLAAGIGALVMGLILLAARLSWRRRLGLGLGALMGGLTVGGLLWQWVMHAQTGSPAARRTIWAATLELIRARPWTGYGLDNLELVFPAVFPPELVYYQGRDVYVDRAHDLLLDWAAAAGIPGAVAGLLILVAALYVGWRAWAHRFGDAAARIHLATVAGVGAASVAGNLAGFHVTATALLLWAALGSVVALHGHNRVPVAAPRRIPRAIRVVASLAGVALILAVLVFGVARPMGAGIAHRAARTAVARGEWTEATELARRAVKLWPHSMWHGILLGETIQGQAARLPPEDQVLRLQEAERTYAELVARHRHDVRAWVAQGAFYAAWPQYVELATAQAAYAQALARSPNLAAIWMDVARLHMAHGDARGALAALERTVDLDATYVDAYRLMGEIYGQYLHDEAAARAAFAQADYWAAETR